MFLCIERGIGENRFSLSVAAKIGIIFVNTKNKIMFFEHESHELHEFIFHTERADNTEFYLTRTINTVRIIFEHRNKLNKLKV